MDANSYSTKSNNLLDIRNNLRPSRHKSDRIHKTKKNIEDFTYFFTKKIKFNSAFDHIGSKQFLNSKKEALELIILDEDSILSDNEIKNNKKIERRMKYENSITKNKRPKSSKNTTDFMEKNNFTNKVLDKKSSKGKNYSEKKNKKKRINTSIVQKFNNKNKKSKFFSSQELKMFEDKEVQKIKPIKKLYKDLEINKKKNNTKISQFQFVGSGISSDSSLFDIVSQMHK